MTSSEKYELVQDELDTLMEKVDSAMHFITSPTSPRRSSDEKRQTAMRLRGHFDEAKKLIDEMEAEARLAPLQFRGEMLSKVRQQREKVALMQNELRQTKISSLSGVSRRQEGVDLVQQSTSQDEQIRRQIMRGIEVMDQTSQSIYRSQQVALETESVGEEIISDLGTQRETLQRAHARIASTNAEISRSRKILRSLYIGVLQNKLFLIVVIMAQLLVIAGLVYWKFIK